MTDVSVVVCAHNEEQYITRQLAALTEQQWHGDWEILVVDNRSTDRTPDIVAEFAAAHPRLRLVRAISRPAMIFSRVCRGSMTASTKPRSVAT